MLVEYKESTKEKCGNLLKKLRTSLPIKSAKIVPYKDGWILKIWLS